MKNSFSFGKQVSVVSSFSDLVNKNFHGDSNAICWERELQGNYEEIVSKLRLRENITEISKQELISLDLSKEGQVAREIILNDVMLLSAFGAQPSLNLLKNYERDDELDFISTDVYSFHVDRSPIPASTFLCTYYGTSSDIIPNDEALQKIWVPEIRQKLKELHDGPESDFEDFLRTYFFDLHYEAKPNATPINLGQGHLWRLAVDHPGQKSLPCIHRAPLENVGEHRLLLIC